MCLQVPCICSAKSARRYTPCSVISTDLAPETAVSSIFAAKSVKKPALQILLAADLASGSSAFHITNNPAQDKVFYLLPPNKFARFYVFAVKMERKKFIHMLN